MIAVLTAMVLRKRHVGWSDSADDAQREPDRKPQTTVGSANDQPQG
jgi:hypothetical protein